MGCLSAIVEACPASNCADKYGDTPLQVALTYAHAKCIAYLQEVDKSAKSS